MKTTLKLIGLVGRFDQLNGNVNSNKTVTLSIATLDIEDGVWTPRNFRRDSETPKGCAGGLSCRLFGSQWESEPPRVLFGCYGPELSWCNSANEYEAAARSIRAMQARSTKIYEARGAAHDAAEETGRWLEACLVDEVWARPDPAAIDHRSMEKGEWQIWNIGRAISEIRGRFPVAAAEAAA